MLKPVGYVDLPPHVAPGDFDHAAVHRRSGRVYVAHTANDAVDVVDGSSGDVVASITGLHGVAGVLVDDARDLVFTSNRAGNTVSILDVLTLREIRRVDVGIGPNGLAHDPGRHRLLSAHVGRLGTGGAFPVSVVDVAAGAVVAEVPVPGRTRWAVYDPAADVFYVNVRDPAVIAVIAAGRPALERVVAVPGAGPHGLDLDVTARRLYCACDDGRLVVVDADRSTVVGGADLAGAPDVIFLHARRHRLYVAVGDPGLVEVFDTRSLERVQTVATEEGAHTLALDAERDTVYALLPTTHRAVVYVDDE